VATEPETTKKDFIRTRLAEELAAGKYERIVTRFPPEPNGYLHIGHAKSICLNFGLANENEGARCHLRFDDTNPSAEDVEYVDSIQDDVRWLGFDWGEHLYYASDYYERLYEFAVELIQKGAAFVCDLNTEQMREYRGTLTSPGTNSPHRDRSVEENLDLFARMRAGEIPEGAKTLRAKIDMTSPVIVMRDPVIYRIQNVHHHRTGDAWCVYPMYDFAHPLSDALENITHSLCTLEFADNRKFYDWILEQVDAPSTPQQIEFARLNLTYTVMSKRILRRLVEEGHVEGWDDPRMPTIAGMRRRGYTPVAVRNFCRDIGVARSRNLVQLAQLESSLRSDLNKHSLRVMAVMRPLKVVIDNFPDKGVDDIDAVNNPEDETAGTRKIPFAKVLYIERDDFMEDPPRKFFRLAPGREVRLRYAYFITCTDVVKDDAGEIVELHCSYDPATRGGDSPDGRKVKATLHWVSAEHALDAEVRLYDTLFTKEDPTDTAEGEDFTVNLNPASLEVVAACKVEPGLAGAAPGERYQFERLGYFCVDADSTDGQPVFNRTVTLKDTWARLQKQQEQQAQQKQKKK
jgi:glutaminyl-tRNA synthetase